MRTDAPRTRHLLRRLLLVLCALLCSLSTGAPAALADDPSAHAKTGPPQPQPKEWTEGGLRIGVDKDGKWCLIDSADGCELQAGQAPGTVAPGEDGTTSDHDKRKAFEEKAFAAWKKKQNQDTEQYKKRAAQIEKCLEKGFEGKHTTRFSYCKDEAVTDTPDPAKTPGDWVAGKISKMASDGLKEVANYVGAGVVWLLKQFAAMFQSISTIDLRQTGLGKALGICTVLSVLLTTFLSLIQWGKTAISQEGGPAATAVIGLLKWGVILSVYVWATQVALNWSDEVSVWIVNYSFEGGGSGSADATRAMQEQLGTLFGALGGGGGAAATAGTAVLGGTAMAEAAVAVVVIAGILCILAICALFLEMLLRQVGIMLLVVTMPLALSGQTADATKEWWPKARNALISLILMKPLITLCFAIGFSSMTQGKGIWNVLVGLVIFILACIAWPVLAKFMVFSGGGDSGGSVASGLLSAAGSSASSRSGGFQPTGPGAVGGGDYSRALESDSGAATARGGQAAGRAGGGGFWGKTAGAMSIPLQAAAMAKDTLESSAANTAAHAGLGSPAYGGRHVFAPPPRAARKTPPEPAEPGGPAPETGPAPVAPPQETEPPAPPKEP